MDWPTTSVEEIPPERFVPPHCPRRSCPTFHGSNFTWKDEGSYWRKQDQREVPRFRCRTCGQGFSLQTFAFSYYLKRAELTVPIAAQLVLPVLGFSRLAHDRLLEYFVLVHRHSGFLPRFETAASSTKFPTLPLWRLTHRAPVRAQCVKQSPER